MHEADNLREIGFIRFKVKKEENSINALFPNNCWIDAEDSSARHWLVRVNAKVTAASRLTIHRSFLNQKSGDLELWRKWDKDLPLPAVNFSRLVVCKDHRGRGIAKKMHDIRIRAARDMGAKSIIITASAKNANLLRRMGFEEIGHTTCFADRPGTIFYAMQLNL